ncbi:hypothetical protein Tco_1302217 [Tanacetum coccineum]
MRTSGPSSSSVLPSYVWCFELGLLLVTTDDNTCRNTPGELRRTRAYSGFLRFTHFLSLLCFARRTWVGWEQALMIACWAGPSSSLGIRSCTKQSGREDFLKVLLGLDLVLNKLVETISYTSESKSLALPWERTPRLDSGMRVRKQVVRSVYVYVCIGKSEKIVPFGVSEDSFYRHRLIRRRFAGVADDRFESVLLCPGRGRYDVGHSFGSLCLLFVQLGQGPNVMTLLNLSEEEFGNAHPMGGLTFPCKEETFTEVMHDIHLTLSPYVNS